MLVIFTGSSIDVGMVTGSREQSHQASIVIATVISSKAKLQITQDYGCSFSLM